MNNIFNEYIEEDSFNHVKNNMFFIKDYIETSSVNLENKRIYNIAVDFTNIKEEVIDTKAIFVKGDTSTSVIEADLILNDRPINLTGYEVIVNIRENDDVTNSFKANTINAIDGKIQMNVPKTFVDEYGKCTFEIYLQKENEVLISQMYFYTVIDSLGISEDTPPEKVSLLQQLINDMMIAKNRLKEVFDLSQSDINYIINKIE